MAVICGTRLPLRCVRAVATVIPALALLACDPRASEQRPEFVYLRTDSVTVAVTVRAEPTVAVGDWLRLNASRSTSDGWRKVALEELPPGTPWIGYIPPAHEAEVAANLRWFAEPKEGVEFDLGSSSGFAPGTRGEVLQARQVSPMGHESCSSGRDQ